MRQRRPRCPGGHRVVSTACFRPAEEQLKGDHVSAATVVTVAYGTHLQVVCVVCSPCFVVCGFVHLLTAGSTYTIVSVSTKAYTGAGPQNRPSGDSAAQRPPSGSRRRPSSEFRVGTFPLCCLIYKTAQQNNCLFYIDAETSASALRLFGTKQLPNANE